MFSLWWPSSRQSRSNLIWFRILYDCESHYSRPTYDIVEKCFIYFRHCTEAHLNPWRTILHQKRSVKSSLMQKCVTSASAIVLIVSRHDNDMIWFDDLLCVSQESFCIDWCKVDDSDSDKYWFCFNGRTTGYSESAFNEPNRMLWLKQCTRCDCRWEFSQIRWPSTSCRGSGIASRFMAHAETAHCSVSRRQATNSFKEIKMIAHRNNSNANCPCSAAKKKTFTICTRHTFWKLGWRRTPNDQRAYFQHCASDFFLFVF